MVYLNSGGFKSCQLFLILPAKLLRLKGNRLGCCLNELVIKEGERQGLVVLGSGQFLVFRM